MDLPHFQSKQLKYALKLADITMPVILNKIIKIFLNIKFATLFLRL